MPQSIFFSWQADSPTRVGRNFLRRVLDDVRDDIASDLTIDEAVRDVAIDQDTQGVAGHPPIVDTIFRKIDAAAVSVADLTFTGKRMDGRPTPNPNVLIEYGWALKVLTYERVICVMNTAYGEPAETNLPFNLRHVRRPICYSLPDNAPSSVRTAERRQLTTQLKRAIRASLAAVPAVAPPPLNVFKIAEEIGGPGRFRAPGQALGFVWDSFPLGPDHELFLLEGPAMWLRVMPTTDPGKRWPPHELREHALQEGRFNLEPLPGTYPGQGISFLRAADGMGASHASPPEENVIRSVVFAFETGEVWSVDTALLGYDPNLLPFIEDNYTARLSDYARFLQLLGVKPPYHWIAGIIGARGRRLAVPPPRDQFNAFPGPKCAADLVTADGEYDPATQTPTAALRPFFDRVFQDCGRPRPDYLPQ
jgi:hypothetical protein